MARIRRTLFLTLLLVIAIGDSTIVWAQNATLPASVMAAAPADVTDANTVRLLVGRSTVLDVGTAVSRVSLTSAEIADALVTSPSQLLVNGKMPGTISMFVWDRNSSVPRRYEIIVQRDLARLSEQLRQLFPGELIDAHSNGKNIVLSGSVTNKDVIEKAVNVASGYVDKRDEVVPLLQIQAGAPSNQVLLRVRFAEVSRSALMDVGASLFTPGYKDRWVGRATTQQFGNALPNFEEDKMVFSDYLNLFLFDGKNQLGAVIKALQTKGQFQSLAEPNLVAESGKEASFLAGGEFPVPIAQGSGAAMAISVMFKEFGIRLTFTPTVIGNRVHLKVKPEVSTLDFGNAVQLNGFRIPALATRRAETELELENGQTFAIAGLMDNQVSSSMQKIPGLGDIPILGLLFRSKAAQKNQTELVVMITPEILPNNSRGVTPNLPRTPEQFLPPLSQDQTVAPKAPAFAAERALSTATVAGIPSTPSQQGQLSPSAAAAAVSNSITSSAPAPVAVAVPIPGPSAKPLTEKELKAIEKTRRAEDEKAAKAAREQLEANRREELKDRERQKKVAAEQEKLAKEQAKRDAEAAKKAAAAAKKQAELNLEYRKGLDAAAAKLSAAKAAYNAELARSQQQ